VSNAPQIVARSWEELQQHIAAIVDGLNDKPALAVAAAANPFMAIEELGYVVAPEARAPIEDRLRFKPKDAARRRQLRERIFELAGMEFDLDSADALYEVLYRHLSLRPYPDANGCIPSFPDTRPLPFQVAGGGELEDPLRALEGKHDVIEPLLAYRKLDASKPRFAAAAQYEAIRRGERTLGVERLAVRLKSRDRSRPDDDPDAAPSRGDSADPPAAEAGFPSSVNINTASESQLELLPGITLALARRIVRYREKNGRFANVADLKNVTGISQRVLELLRPHVTTKNNKSK